MNQEFGVLFPGSSLCRGIRSRFVRFAILNILLAEILLGGTSGSPDTPQKRNILILSEVGMSHPLNDLITQEIVAGVRAVPGRHVEFFSENLGLMFPQASPSQAEMRNWLERKYRNFKLDVVVAVGPETVKFLANSTQSLFLDAPIVICGSPEDQAGNPRLDSRFTGTWTKRDPVRTLEAAFRLFPDTRHIIVVAGNSVFDRAVLSYTKESLESFRTDADFTYMTDMEMSQLLSHLRQRPEHSIVLYLSFFEDAVGDRFLNATKALPMVVTAADAPVFGMSDTYVGNGIVGGDVARYREQGKITAKIVSDLLDGKKSQEIPMHTLASEYTFDEKMLERWHVPESRLPLGSIVMFREPSLWERTRWIWTTSLAIILGLCVLTAYLLYNRNQLESAKDRQQQLSGMLISAAEKERSRLASELHDDYSQRLAVLSLGLENLAERLPPLSEDAGQQIQDLVDSASELGADFHTLSHRLHSSTLEKLGLVTAASALCKEYGAQNGFEIEFCAKNIPRTIQPDVALCAFRIVQEGLRNARKHSGATKATVELTRVGDNLRVSVSDEGTGFDVDELSAREGLGLRSMEERASFLGGRFELYAELGKGTRIQAQVPLAPPMSRAKGHAG